MLAETLSLNNFLLHMDYIDRQMLLEQHDGDINKKIEEIINKNKEKENDNGGTNYNDATNSELQKDVKTAELSLIEPTYENNLNKPLNAANT